MPSQYFIYSFLETIERRHNGEKPYKYNPCPYGLKMGDLNVHKLIHESNLSNYPCAHMLHYKSNI